MPTPDTPGPARRAVGGGMVGRGRRPRCCRSRPRCRACPLTLMIELREVRQLAVRAETELPPHLAGVPRSLHKYEPLLRKSWEARAGEERGAKEREAKEHAAVEPMRLPQVVDDKTAA
jgi:hypothetical protein